MERYKEIERSIITKYRKDIYAKFVRAIADYKLIDENDNIMVCISGGKDSFLLAKLFQEIINHGNVSFNAHYVVMNPGYSKENIDKIKYNAKVLNISIDIFESDIFKVADSLNEKNPCYLCARMRRGHLYSYAKKIGCNKIALGHHFNDFIETTLLSMFYSSEVKTMMPKLHSDNYPGIELIRPMCLIKEEHIKSWVKYNNLNFLNCACKFMDRNKDININSKRLEMKELINHMLETNENVMDNIYKAMENVNLNCVLGYRDDNGLHSFLDDYDK